MQMDRRAHVVIGAGYGDEGKGLMTDHHGAPAGTEAIVARFNGGAQAGHTVTMPDGRRHVFSHFGSATLAGGATFLARDFACHPQLFLKEAALLQQADSAKPVVHVDLRAMVTTPYDMLVNQLLERRRGDGRHGSCGLGFGETVQRCLDPVHALHAGDLAKGDGFLLHRLERLRSDYLPRRLAALGARGLTEEENAMIQSDALMEDFVAAAAQFCAMTSQASPSILLDYRRIVMEGAQGLLLDQARGEFPYVTRSYTGVRNALVLAREAGIATLDLTYCSRAYLTRHGAGPLARELPALPYAGIRDDTNLRNEFQGALRFAHLDLDLLAHSIQSDHDDARGSGIATTLSLALTCLDQVGESVAWYGGREKHEAAPEGLLDAARRALTPVALYASHGPMRDDVSLA